MKPDCEYCGAALPEGVDKKTRQKRSAHFAQHTAERQKEESGVHFTAHNMVSKQPEALRLADYLDDPSKPLYAREVNEAADELRRLHALCDGMGEALKCIVEFSSPMTAQQHELWPAMRGAYEKWKESK